MLNTRKIRKYFPAIKSGRIVSNNAASTQTPAQLLDLLKKLSVKYDNVHRCEIPRLPLRQRKYLNLLMKQSRSLSALNPKKILFCTGTRPKRSIP